MSHTKETNVVICANLLSDASPDLVLKLHEARGALEAMIKCGVYPPGEEKYVISRKGLKGNQAPNWDSTGTWGHTFKSAVQENANVNSPWSGDHRSLWVNRTDKVAVFRTIHDNDRYYAALSTATRGMFSSDG